MESDKVSEQLKYISSTAVTLNTEERMQLEYALSSLQSTMQFEKLFFWGKVTGIETDYYVAVGQNTLGRKNFPERIFYFCQPSNWQFSLLEPAKTALAPIFEQIQTMFTGESERQIVNAQGISDQVRLLPGTLDGLVLPEKGVTEQDRLSYVVQSIERQCQVVPVGSYKKNTLGEGSQNEAFRGLRFADLTSLDNFMQLRPVEQKEKVEQAAREEDIFNHELFDSAALQKPTEGWTIMRDEVFPGVVVLRSRLWPGFAAYARASTAIYGGIYIGNGIKQLDLPFML